MEENSNLKEQLKEIDETIVKLQKDIKIGEALEALHTNEDFILVFLEGYFDAEEKRISGLLFNPTSLKRDQIENIMDKAAAIRNTKQYIATLLINANMAPEQIDENEAYRKQVTASMTIDVEVEE